MCTYRLPYTWGKPPTPVDGLEGGEGTATAGGRARIVRRVDPRSLSGVDGGVAGGDPPTRGGRCVGWRGRGGRLRGSRGRGARDGGGKSAGPCKYQPRPWNLDCEIIQSSLVVNTVSRGMLNTLAMVQWAEFGCPKTRPVPDKEIMMSFVVVTGTRCLVVC